MLPRYPKFLKHDPKILGLTIIQFIILGALTLSARLLLKNALIYNLAPLFIYLTFLISNKFIRKNYFYYLLTKREFISYDEIKNL